MIHVPTCLGPETSQGSNHAENQSLPRLTHRCYRLKSIYIEITRAAMEIATRKSVEVWPASSIPAKRFLVKLHYNVIKFTWQPHQLSG